MRTSVGRDTTNTHLLLVVVKDVVHAQLLATLVQMFLHRRPDLTRGQGLLGIRLKPGTRTVTRKCEWRENAANPPVLAPRAP